MDKHLCESCFLWNILERSMSLTHHKWIMFKIRRSTMWPELSGSLRMTCVQGMCHRSCIRNRGAVVYVWVMGQPQACEKWMILSKCWVFFPSATVFYISLSPFALLYNLLPASAFKGLRWRAAVHCSFCLHSTTAVWLPHWSVFWLDSDGGDGWRENYMLSNVSTDTANSEKNNSSVAPQCTGWSYPLYNF